MSNAFYEIDEAVEFLVAAGTPSSVADLRPAVCGTPSMEVFDRELDDAWAALQADLAAARRRDAGFSEHGDGCGLIAELLEQPRRLPTDRGEAQKAEAVELADQMAAEIEQLRARCADLEERVRAEREGAEQLRRQLSSATERAAAAEVRAAELTARAADLNEELERVHADLGAECRFGSTERHGCSCACRCT